ncbi:MAG: hypothetical protein HY023_17435 [Chloroflexi bacterium]|nr:hypothetical protein [Chloroflexota bacterium]
MTDRFLPNSRLRHVMLGIEQTMGLNGLNVILRRAGQDRFVGHLPPDNREPGMTPFEYSALNQAIEEYYGRSARAMFLRIGRAAYQEQRKAAGLGGTIAALLSIPLSPQARVRRSLKRLAARLAEPDGRCQVYLDDQRLVFVDETGDACVNRPHEAPNCWLHLGLIQEAVHSAGGIEIDVTETTCIAKGDPACRFEIGESR